MATTLLLEYQHSHNSEGISLFFLVYTGFGFYEHCIKITLRN